jgi:hypothetical protein
MYQVRPNASKAKSRLRLAPTSASAGPGDVSPETKSVTLEDSTT